MSSLAILRTNLPGHQVSSATRQLSVVSRIAAAAVGGYAFANVVGILVARVLPLTRADAVLAMTLASFALYATAIVWAFAARSAAIAWLGLLVPVAVCGSLAWLLGAA